jgi:tRNA (guanine-N7-)-methyltransferase
MILHTLPKSYLSSLRQPSLSLLSSSSAFSTSTSAITTDTDTDTHADAASTPHEFRKYHEFRQPQPRFRQHVNPLSSCNQISRVNNDDAWVKKSFSRPEQDFHVDIGCAKGNFILEMSALHPTMNYLGLEIRSQVVEYALTRLDKRPLTNCHFVACNANVDLNNVTEAIAAANSRVKTVSIQFPDPHFKERHKKRRVVTPHLVSTIVESIKSTQRGDEVIYLASDIQEVLDSMRATFRDHPDTIDETFDVNEYYKENIFAVPTERETSVFKNEGSVWRAVFKIARGATTSAEDMAAGKADLGANRFRVP